MPTPLPASLGISHSEAIAEAYASATAGDPVLVALEISHPLWDEPVRVVNDFRNLTATLEATAPYNAGEAVEFTAVPFRYIKMEQTADLANSGAPAAVGIEIDNVSRHITELLILARTTLVPVTVIEREYLPSDTSAPHVLPVTVLTMSDISVTVDTARGKLSFGNLTNRKFPTRVYESILQTLVPTSFLEYEVNLDAVTNAGTTSAVGVVLSGLDPALTYSITQPPGGAHAAWLQNSDGLYKNHFRITAPDGSVTLAGTTAAISFGYPTPEDARAAFPGASVTGHSSYTFWIYDTPTGDNSGGLTLRLRA